MEQIRIIKLLWNQIITYFNKNNENDNNSFNLLQENKENNPNFINSFKNE